MPIVPIKRIQYQNRYINWTVDRHLDFSISFSIQYKYKYKFYIEHTLILIKWKSIETIFKLTHNRIGSQTIQYVYKNTLKIGIRHKCRQRIKNNWTHFIEVFQIVVVYLIINKLIWDQINCRKNWINLYVQHMYVFSRDREVIYYLYFY